MSLCIATAGKVVMIPVTAFSLSWIHSVEKTAWKEDWAVTSSGLELKVARVKGSGAGMEPGDDAVLENGWWRWLPKLPPLQEVRLAASGETSGGWQLCNIMGCMTLGEAPGDEAILSACEQVREAVEPSR